MIKDLIKVVEGKPLSPVLVVSGKKHADIADGYHRVSLVYRIDPYADVPLKLAWPAGDVRRAPHSRQR